MPLGGALVGDPSRATGGRLTGGGDSSWLSFLGGGVAPGGGAFIGGPWIDSRVDAEGAQLVIASRSIRAPDALGGGAFSRFGAGGGAFSLFGGHWPDPVFDCCKCNDPGGGAFPVKGRSSLVPAAESASPMEPGGGALTKPAFPEIDFISASSWIDSWCTTGTLSSVEANQGSPPSGNLYWVLPAVLSSTSCSSLLSLMALSMSHSSILSMRSGLVTG